MDLFNSLTVLSLEQATTLPYMTLRLAQDGLRVIRLEAPPRGDPNRWVGPEVLPATGNGQRNWGQNPVSESGGEPGMNAYFLPNNLGKQSITLNLATAAGRDLLHRLIATLPVDVFATNQRPRSYAKLGIDYDTLRQIKPDLIWLGISGFGPQRDEAAYDPILQARAGFMDLTGEPDGEPMVFGLPMVDLGAGEHAYGLVMKALYRRAVTGEGARLDLSMFQSAASWMVAPVMLSHSFGIASRRHGNTHQFFAPASVYPTADGFVYLAVGNDRQWQAITELLSFGPLDQPAYRRNAGRIADVEALNRQITAVTRIRSTASLLADFQEIGVPISPVKTLAQVCADPLVADHLVRARDSRSGVEIAIPAPPYISDYLRRRGLTLPFPPRLGEHNEAIFGGLGCDVAALRAEGVI
jgi:crotonobetainyl-CoA:carnitine CoA-transferase CaiB-like acyl-CoA transferase